MMIRTRTALTKTIFTQRIRTDSEETNERLRENGFAAKRLPMLIVHIDNRDVRADRTAFRHGRSVKIFQVFVPTGHRTGGQTEIFLRRHVFLRRRWDDVQQIRHVLNRRATAQRRKFLSMVRMEKISFHVVRRMPMTKIFQDPMPRARHFRTRTSIRRRQMRKNFIDHVKNASFVQFGQNVQMFALRDVVFVVASRENSAFRRIDSRRRRRGEITGIITMIGRVEQKRDFSFRGRRHAFNRTERNVKTDYSLSSVWLWKTRSSIDVVRRDQIVRDDSPMNRVVAAALNLNFSFSL